MKALVLSTAYPDPVRTTHGVFVHERVRAVARRADVRVLAPTPWHRSLRGGVPRHEVRDGVPVEHPRYWYVPRYLKGLDGWALYRSVLGSARRLLRERDVDLLDAHFAWPEGFAAVHLGRTLGKPVVVTLRGTLEWLSDDPARGPRMAWTVRHATRLVAVSRPLAERAIALGADPQRVHVVPNGVDVERFPVRDRAGCRAELGLPLVGPLLVSVGHLSPRKGFQTVIDVLGELRASHPGAHLVVVGGPGAEGDNSGELRGQVQRLGLTGAVTFAGNRSPQEVGRYLAAGDLFVLASRYEGCPNVVLEAMACARPVVVSRVGETERMVPATAGIVYGTADDRGALLSALRRALDTPWDPTAIRAHAEAHTWDRVAERVLAVWQDALSETAPRGGHLAVHDLSHTPDARPDGPLAPGTNRLEATRTALPR